MIPCLKQTKSIWKGHMTGKSTVILNLGQERGGKKKLKNNVTWSWKDVPMDAPNICTIMKTGAQVPKSINKPGFFGCQPIESTWTPSSGRDTASKTWNRVTKEGTCLIPQASTYIYTQTYMHDTCLFLNHSHQGEERRERRERKGKRMDLTLKEGKLSNESGFYLGSVT